MAAAAISRTDALRAASDLDRMLGLGRRVQNRRMRRNGLGAGRTSVRKLVYGQGMPSDSSRRLQLCRDAAKAREELDSVGAASWRRRSADALSAGSPKRACRQRFAVVTLQNLHEVRVYVQQRGAGRLGHCPHKREGRHAWVGVR